MRLWEEVASGVAREKGARGPNGTRYGAVCEKSLSISIAVAFCGVTGGLRYSREVGCLPPKPEDLAVRSGY